MILRMKNESFKVDNSSVLLDYLGIKKDVSGIHTVKNDVQLIACVPFAKEKRKERKEESGDCIDEGFAWTLSTFDLDRTGERIDPMGWDIKRYMENPIVEWSHRYDIPAIGKIERLVVDNAGLHGLVVFNDKEYDPFGWSIGQRVKAGVIRAGSVGFRVMEIEIPDRETARDGTDLIFRKQELLEFSICNVPANPFALAKAMRNEELGMRSERSVNVNPVWDCLINNL